MLAMDVDLHQMESALAATRKYVGIDVEHCGRADLGVREANLADVVCRNDHVRTDFLTVWVLKEAVTRTVGIGNPQGSSSGRRHSFRQGAIRLHLGVHGKSSCRHTAIPGL
jgi:hypothetical protein